MSRKPSTRARATGIGGIFFKSENPEKARAWYREHLGLPTEEWGCEFKWRSFEDPESEGSTTWSAFAADTEYFAPSEAPFMVNFRVDDLDSLLAQLKESGIERIGDIEESEFGRFAWVLDADGNKIELWQPPEA